jgi:biotin transporter BioY
MTEFSFQHLLTGERRQDRISRRAFMRFDVGYCRDRYCGAKSAIPIIVLMFIADLILFHIPGLMVLGIYYSMTQGSLSAVTDLLKLGTLPFVLGDTIKILIAAWIARTVLVANPSSRENRLDV